jgi:hypothetical protein
MGNDLLKTGFMTDYHFIGQLPAAQYAEQIEFVLNDLIPATEGKNPDHYYVGQFKTVARLLQDGLEKARINDMQQREITQLRLRLDVMAELETSKRLYIAEMGRERDYELWESQQRARQTLSDAIYRKTKGEPEPPTKEWEPGLRKSLDKVQREASP